MSLSHTQASSHLVKTGWLDFSLGWLYGEMKENLDISLLAINNVSLSFTEQTCCTTIFKRMQSTSLQQNIEYLTLHGSNFRNNRAPFTWILKKKLDYWWTNTALQKLTGRLKICILVVIGRFQVKKSATSPGLVRYKIWKSKPPSCKISILENSESLALQDWNLIFRQLRFLDLVLDSIKLQYAQRFLARNQLGRCFFVVKCHKISVKCRWNFHREIIQIRA